MNNLKRVLSLGLTGAMLTGMMMVGASAADFTDAEDIVHTDAVNTMVALNVINGKEDGSYFDPNGSLTRAEMAKLAVFVLHGGKNPVLGTKVNPTFSDIDNHWAESYIEYCSSTGIINGRGDGTFDPAGTLTGSEAAKMLLVAMGYNAKVFELTGADWEINTNVKANEAGLYEELDGMDPTQTISRDNAAQLVYNAILAPNMVRSWTLDKETGKNTESYNLDSSVTLFSTKFDGKVYEGTLVASGNYDPTADVTESDDYFTVDVDTVNGTTNTIDDKAFKLVGEDLTALVGTNVKVMANNKDTVYGVFSTDANTVVTARYDTIKLSSTAGEIKIDGTTYKYNTGANVYTGNNDAGTTIASTFGTSAVNQADMVTFIDNDNDEVFDLALIANPVAAPTKVTFANATSFTTDGANVKYDSEKHILPEGGFEKGDYVIKSTDLYTGKTVFEKAEIVTGKVTGNTGAKYKVEGEWYPAATGVTPSLDTKYDLVLVDGMIYVANAKTSAITDVALVVGASNNMDIEGHRQAKLLFTDGTQKVVAVTNTDPESMVVDAAGTTMTTNKALVLYTVEDGVYTLETLDDTNAIAEDKGGFGASEFDTAQSTCFDKATKTLDGKKIADDATIFVQYVDGGKTYYKVMTGAQLASMGTNFGDRTVYAYSTSGINYVKLAFITDDTYLPGAAADKVWGYVVSDVTTTTEDGKTTYTFTVFDGEKEVEVTSKTIASATKGDVISFNYSDDDMITGLAVVIESTDAPVAIEDFSNTSKIIKFAGDGTTYNYDEDMVVLYVDSKDVKGVVGGEIAKAEKPLGAYVPNAKMVAVDTDSTPGADTVTVLVVDVASNKWAGADPVGAPESPVAGGTTNDEMNAKDDGLYVPADSTCLPSGGEFTGTPAQNRIFKFTGVGAATYELSIKNSDGDEVYTETATAPINGGRFFWVSLVADGTHPNAGEGDYKLAPFAAGDYTYRVTADGTALVSGSFNVAG